MNPEIKAKMDELDRVAVKRYHSIYHAGGFVNELFKKATNGKSVAFSNALIDEALALCGSPYYKVTHRKWGKAAEAFLLRFV